MISYLPLSHVAAQMMDIHAALHTGLTIHFAQPDALKGSLAVTLKVGNLLPNVVQMSMLKVTYIQSLHTMESANNCNQFLTNFPLCI